MVGEAHNKSRKSILYSVVDLDPAAHNNNNFKMHIIDFLTQLSMDFCRLLT